MKMKLTMKLILALAIVAALMAFTAATALAADLPAAACAHIPETPFGTGAPLSCP